jgi:uncharacterized membrane protein YccC
MTSKAIEVRRALSVTVEDRQRFLFSLASFLAAAATLGLSFVASLPRPWWALLTVYVTAQPMSGAFRPKVFYRIAGILTGATVTIVVVPLMQNSPEILVPILAGWTGTCIYFAVLDRTPRAFVFQMAAFSSAVMTFPYLDDPADIFSTTVARVEEMALGIVSVTLAHAILQPWSATRAIKDRSHSFLADAGRWTAEALGKIHTSLEYEHRRILAADVTELGMIAIHLPFDQVSPTATRQLVRSLQGRLASILPLASAAANRLDQLRVSDSVAPDLAELVEEIRLWLADADSVHVAGAGLVERCRRMAADRGLAANWSDLLTANLCDRMGTLIEALSDCRAEASRIGALSVEDASGLNRSDRGNFSLARDRALAVLAGTATAVAIILYCLVWLLLQWPNGYATAAFAALITCSFASQDDPAPIIMRYLKATLITFPVGALYLFVILPRVDGYGMLVVTLAPALLWMGYIQADPARSARALPMFSCFIVALGFLDRFQIDFALFVNTGLAQIGGIVVTIAVTKMFRSANVRWTVRRIVCDNWADIEALANIRRPFQPERWTAQAIDRLGQIAARMALAEADDDLHAADGLADLRIGRNVIAIRGKLTAVPHEVRKTFGAVLSEVSALFADRRRSAQPTNPPPSLLRSIDVAIESILTVEPRGQPTAALLALVGMRCNLFAGAAPFQRENAQ